MKNFPCLFTLASVATLPFAHGAAFVDNFSGLTPGTPGTALAGYNGWAQNQPNPIAPGDPLAWGQLVGSTNGFGLGPGYSAPSSDPLYVSHNLSFGLASASLQTTFVVVDSDSAFPARNNYSIGIFNLAGTRLFSLDMLATSQTLTPDTPPNNEQWNLKWSSGASTSAAFGGVLEDGLYTMVASFRPDGADVDFDLMITGSNSFSISGTLAGMASETIAQYRVSTTIGDGSGWGDGFIGIKGVAVPEPTSAVLLGLGALGFIARRRR